MRHLAALALLIAPSTTFAQEADPVAKLRTAWPKITDAWKAVGAFKEELAKDIESGRIPKTWASDQGKVLVLPDSFLRGSARMAAALEEAGLMGDDLPPEMEAFKSAFKARLASVVRLQSFGYFPTPTTNEEYNRLSQEYSAITRTLQEEFQRAVNEYSMNQGGVRPGGPPPAAKPATPVAKLEEAARTLLRMRESGSVEEDREQDALSRIREALRDLGLMDDDTPAWMRARLTILIRAAATGEAFPEPPRATAEQRKRISTLLTTLRDGAIDEREAAGRELSRTAEGGLDLIRAALADAPDDETKLRLKKVLGFREKKAEPPAPPRPPRPWK